VNSPKLASFLAVLDTPQLAAGRFIGRRNGYEKKGTFKECIRARLNSIDCSGVPGHSASGRGGKTTGDFTAAVMSQYVWRGYELSRNSIVIQPSMTVGYKGFSVNLWGNLDTNPTPPSARRTRARGTKRI